MIVFSFFERKPPFKLIDMFVNEPIKFEEIYKRKIKVKIGDIKVPVISIDHLIRLKEQAGRDRDKNDIIQLVELKRLLKK